MPNAFPEIERVEYAYRGKSTSLVRGHAVRDPVLDELPRHTIAHFSCHGGQDLARPGNGGLVLTDGLLTVRDLAARVAVGTELAHLSACRTAISGTRLQDESIHLAAALQAIGFRHVVAALWSV